MLPRSNWKNSTYELAWRQQFFAWGQDVVSEHGNLLQKFGFRKLPRHTQARFSEYIWDGLEDAGTRVTPDLRPHQVHLWAFGVCSTVGEHSLYYSRSSLQPWLINVTPQTLPNSHEDWMTFLSLHRCSRCADTFDIHTLRILKTSLFNWVTYYEKWVQSEVGAAYRDETTGFRKDSIVQGRELKDLWQSYIL